MKRWSETILRHPAFAEEPLVLVDVGASGGVPAEWRDLAPFAVVLAFDPDARETRALSHEQHRFRRWHFAPHIVVAESDRPRARLFLTRSPFCSSTLPPHESLERWAFAEHFRVEREVELPAQALAAALRDAGLTRIDWLKCDTQGTDVRIFRSLPEAVRRGVQRVEFEPGLIDAYRGEDKFHELLRVMEGEPFWLADLEINRTPRGRPALLRRELGAVGATLYRDFGHGTPAWVNATYLREFTAAPATVRDALVALLFAFALGQPAVALDLAESAGAAFPDPLFGELAAQARRQLQWRTWRNPRRWLTALKRAWRQKAAPTGSTE